jgi:hypothetical protein
MKPPDYESELIKNQTTKTGLTKRYAAAEASPNYLIQDDEELAGDVRDGELEIVRDQDHSSDEGLLSSQKVSLASLNKIEL